MTNFNSFIQRLSRRQTSQETTRKGIPSTVRIYDLFVLERIDSKFLDAIKAAGGDSDSWLSAVGDYDNAIAGGVGFRFLRESPSDCGEILGIRETVRAGPGLGFGLVTNKIINVGEDFLELIAEKLSDEWSREVEDEDLGK